MLYLGDTHRAAGSSRVTKLFIYLLLVGFFILHRYPDGSADPTATLVSASLIPARFLDYESAFRFLDVTPLPVSLLWSQLLCANALQLLFCVAYIWILGHNLEARLGWRRYLLLLSICTVAGEIAFIFGNWGESRGTVGPLAAVAGLLGAYFAYFPNNRFRLELRGRNAFYKVFRFPFKALLAVWAAFQLSLFFLPSPLDAVAPYAQIAGLITGYLLARTGKGYANPRFKVYENKQRGPFYGRD